jgi:hypothetical protein
LDAGGEYFRSVKAAGWDLRKRALPFDLIFDYVGSIGALTRDFGEEKADNA